MTNRINPEGKLARDKIRLVMRETERLLDRLLKDSQTIIPGDVLATQVALNLGLTLQEVKPIVAIYTYTRTDLTLKPGWHGAGKSRWYGQGIGKK